MNCQNCEHVGTYQGIPAHWCEFFSPGVLNLNYPKTMQGCPNHSETQPNNNPMNDYW